jgi:predicted deacylase
LPDRFAIPDFAVALTPPDLAPWRAGNTGVPGFYSFRAAKPGAHVALVSLMHGNEIAGAIALDRLLRAGLRPDRGRLTIGFANLNAFSRFDPRHPTASRFIDEDLNRLWDLDVLEGGRESVELDRAREMRPLLDTVDRLLDLHSMLWPSEPLILCGESPKGRGLAFATGLPGLIVADSGHVTGRRLIDYQRFVSPATDAAAILVEAGQHWQEACVALTMACIGAFLRATGALAAHPLLPAAAPPGKPRYAEVTQVVTAATGQFAFASPFNGGECIPRAGTLIAHDGEAEIRTPYDQCLLVMPTLRPSRGHTAVRLARMIMR